MNKPKGYIEIKFGNLLPGDEFLQPGDLNTVLIKRLDGGRFSKTNPTGVLGNDKIVFARGGQERQGVISGLERTLLAIQAQVVTLLGEIKKLEGEEKVEAVLFSKNEPKSGDEE